MDMINDQNMLLNDQLNEVNDIAERMIQEQLFVSFEEFREMTDPTNEVPDDIQTDIYSQSEQEVIGDIDKGDVRENVQDLSQVEEWLSDINPNYDPFDADPAYENNCGSCAYAVSRRLDGDTEIVAGRDNIGYNEEMEEITGNKIINTTAEEIELALIEQGPGAHAIVGIDRFFGPGHWFNAYCPDGENVYYIDGQCNVISDWPPKDLGLVSNWVMEVKED